MSGHFRSQTLTKKAALLLKEIDLVNKRFPIGLKAIYFTNLAGFKDEERVFILPLVSRSLAVA